MIHYGIRLEKQKKRLFSKVGVGRYVIMTVKYILKQYGYHIVFMYIFYYFSHHYSICFHIYNIIHPRNRLHLGLLFHFLEISI